jgi:histidinol-phosphate aminotransferase
MPSTRRDFLRRIGAGGAALVLAPRISARGFEAAHAAPPPRRFRAGTIRLDSNENPNGPSAAALDAIRASLSEASRYPDDPERALTEAIAARHGVRPEEVLLGSGSTEILRIAVMAHCGPARPLVTAAPTFEQPAGVARTIGAPAIEVPLGPGLRLDLDAMAGAAAPSAGLVFCCNPNNPTGTVHGAAAITDFVQAVHRAAPGAVILIDEAYHEYVEDPGYASALPMVRDPRVIVCRTFSKVYGLAGIRAGYAVGHRDTIARMRPWRIPNGISVAASAAAIASLAGQDHLARQQRLNREARAFTRRLFEDLGYPVAPSEANFLMVDLRRDARAFRDACRSRGVAVGRQFPPLLTWTRISIGTMDEMTQASRVFRTVLAGA